jgi:hypothetical protein
VIWVKSEPEYFCEGGLNGPNQIKAKSEISFAALGPRVKCTVSAIPG